MRAKKSVRAVYDDAGMFGEIYIGSMIPCVMYAEMLAYQKIRGTCIVVKAMVMEIFNLDFRWNVLYAPHDIIAHVIH